MEKQNIIKAVIGSVLGIAFLYMLFNWTMSAVVHSRKEVMVPDLNGKSLDAAVTAISPLNLGIKKEGEEFNQKVPAGTIIRQNPLPGMTVREGKIVRVTISQGGKVTFVPDMVGQQVRSAEITIRSAGLSLGEESSRFSIVVEKGCVVSQDPAAGAIAEKDSMVNLVISAGQPPEGTVLMPRWIDKNVEDAKQWAQQNSIELTITEEKSASFAPGMVISQEPSPDTDMTLQRSVTLTVAGNEGNASAENKFYYEIPQGGEERQVRLTLIDENGEKEIYQGIRMPGSKLEIPVTPKGSARVRVFINNILVEEREVK